MHRFDKSLNPGTTPEKSPHPPIFLFAALSIEIVHTHLFEHLHPGDNKNMSPPPLSAALPLSTYKRKFQYFYVKTSSRIPLQAASPLHGDKKLIPPLISGFVGPIHPRNFYQILLLIVTKRSHPFLRPACRGRRPSPGLPCLLLRLPLRKSP